MSQKQFPIFGFYIDLSIVSLSCTAVEACIIRCLSLVVVVMAVLNHMSDEQAGL